MCCSKKVLKVAYVLFIFGPDHEYTAHFRECCEFSCHAVEHIIQILGKLQKRWHLKDCPNTPSNLDNLRMGNYNQTLEFLRRFFQCC